MFIAAVLALMLILPVASIAIDVIVGHHGVLEATIVGRWCVFWMVGVRLFLAGLRQILQPRFTAETILGAEGPGALFVVRELGFANTAVGSAGLGTLLFAAWTLPLAVIGAIFYALAGINHMTHGSRNRLENAVMLSDLFAAVVLLSICSAFTRWV